MEQRTGQGAAADGWLAAALLRAAEATTEQDVQLNQVEAVDPLDEFRRIERVAAVSVGDRAMGKQGCRRPRARKALVRPRPGGETDAVEPLVDHRSVLLGAYDEQLRGVAEMQGAQSWDRDGPLYRALWERRGFVSYESLAGVKDLDDLIQRTVAYFAGTSQVEEFEWKSRGHDHPADLDTRLQRAGLVPEEVETVMVGEAAKLAVEVELPPEVVIRRVDQLPEPERTEVIAAASAMQRDVFGGGPSTQEVIARLDRLGDDEQFWVAEAAHMVVCAGRLSRVAGSEFAGLWGGATAPEWRGKGVYRALTAARASAAVAAGVRYLHSDCTAMSRPILERSGLVAVTTTTPYRWGR